MKMSERFWTLATRLTLSVGVISAGAAASYTVAGRTPDTSYPGMYEPCSTDTTKLTIRVAVTRPLADLYPEVIEEIPAAFAWLTKSLAAAGLPQPELVAGPIVNGSEANDTGREWQRLADPSDGYWDTLAKRDTDIVVLAVLNGGYEKYGWSHVGARPSTAYAIVTHNGMVDPAMMSLSHEFGHLAGLRHEKATDPLETPLPAAHAYVQGSFRTLMASACRGCQRQPYWANPDAPLPSGEGRMGVKGETEVVSGLARTLPYLATFHCP
jgi:hypothetical protein